MSDYSELKRLATRIVEVQASQDVPISKLFDDFDAATSPEVILALIAENEQLNAENDEPEWHLMMTKLEDRNAELKAENEALLAAAQALRDEWRKDQADAERYRFLANRTFFVDGLFRTPSPDPVDGSNPLKGSVSQHFEDAIDAAMGKGDRGAQSTSKTSESTDPEGPKGGGQ